jgi:hypothetical protein
MSGDAPSAQHTDQEDHVSLLIIDVPAHRSSIDPLSAALQAYNSYGDSGFSAERYSDL